MEGHSETPLRVPLNYIANTNLNQLPVSRQGTQASVAHHHRSYGDNPIQFIERVTRIQPFEKRGQAKIDFQAEKNECLPDHSIKNKVQGYTNNQLKQSTIVHWDKKRGKVRNITTTHLGMVDYANPFDCDLSAVNIRTIQRHRKSGRR